MQSVYVDIVRELKKSREPDADKPFLRLANALHDKYEPKVLAAVLKALRSSRNRFVQKFSVDKVTALFESLKKSSSDDIKAEILKVLEASLDVELTEAILDALEPFVDELAKTFATVEAVDLNFKTVNAKATDFLSNSVRNDFSTLADSQAKGIYGAISDSMASEDGYTIKTIVQGIKDELLSDVLYFDTKQGVREMDATTWATTVARTETARAASFATKSILGDLGLQTWEWHAQGSACDECDSNDGEVVTIGDEFPSGDTEAPAHPSCRCICTVVREELNSLDDGSSEDEDSSD